MITYTPLDEERKQLRVLTLLPGRPDAPIVCTLSTSSLNDYPQFEALSYVWGDAKKRKDIVVDDQTISVTENLENALRALRLPKKPRTLWVDAVCIDQQNTSEKNYQVPHMATIYFICTAVVVWLGPSTPEIELALSWMQTYVAKQYTGASAFWMKLDSKGVFSKKAKMERDLAVLKAFEGYFEILLKPYWNRMWTFQEYRLAEDEPICYCGEISFQASILGKAQDEIHKAGYAVLTASVEPGGLLAPGREWSDYSKAEKDAAIKIDKARKVLLDKSTAALKNAITSPKNFREPWTNKESQLLYLLTITAERQCYDPRDKVYALYGMELEIPKIYPPDYDKPVEKVIIETTAFLVNHERGPIMYSTFGLRDGRLEHNSVFPSWVPEFSDGSITAPNIHRCSSERLAPALRKWEEAPPAEVDEKLSTLTIFARNLGQCQVVVRFSETKEETCQQVFGLLKLDPAVTPDPAVMEKMRNYSVERMARLLVAHDPLNTRHSDKEIVDTFQLMYESMKPGAETDIKKGSTWWVVDSAIKTLAGKRLIITPDGIYGVCVSAGKDGDIATLPPQVRAPLLFRPEADGYYRMVGTAILDGVMEKKLLEEELVSEVEKKGLEKFLVH